MAAYKSIVIRTHRPVDVSFKNMVLPTDIRRSVFCDATWAKLITLGALADQAHSINVAIDSVAFQLLRCMLEANFCARFATLNLFISCARFFILCC